MNKKHLMHCFLEPVYIWALWRSVQTVTELAPEAAVMSRLISALGLMSLHLSSYYLLCWAFRDQSWCLGMVEIWPWLSHLWMVDRLRNFQFKIFYDSTILWTVGRYQVRACIYTDRWGEGGGASAEDSCSKLDHDIMAPLSKSHKTDLGNTASPEMLFSITKA